MGVDITMSIIKGTEYLYKDIYDGRCSEWFQNLQDEGWDSEYDYLDIRHGIPKVCPQDWVDSYNEENHGYYYGHRYIKVIDFINWFEKYHPETDAGWVSKRDAWLYKNKGIVPELQYHLSEEDRVEDMEFIEVKNPNDQSLWLYKYLIDKKEFLVSLIYKEKGIIDCEDAMIIYKFDC